MHTALPKVLVTRNLPESGLALLREHCAVQQWASDDVIPRDTLKTMLADKIACLALLTDRFDAELFDAAPGLKVVANLAVGFDNLDVDEATRRGVVLTNTPDVLTDATADYAWALLLAAARQIVPNADYVKAGKWKTWEPMGFLGPNIHHATLGIVGMGRIGHEVARRAHGFKMRIIYHDPQRAADAERDYGAEYCTDLDEVLRVADFVSLHVPLRPSTHHLIDRRSLALMKPRAVLINTARGAVVDPDALYDILAAGRIYAAAMDVTEPEPIPPDHQLLSLPNCLVTSHIASATFKTRDEMCELAARNILAVLHGERPLTPINPDVLEQMRI